PAAGVYETSVSAAPEQRATTDPAPSAARLRVRVSTVARGLLSGAAVGVGVLMGVGSPVAAVGGGALVAVRRSASATGPAPLPVNPPPARPTAPMPTATATAVTASQEATRSAGRRVAVRAAGSARSG